MPKKRIIPVKRVYWVDEPKRGKQLLIFDGGYYGGDIHVYKYKKSFSPKVARSELEKSFGRKLTESEIPDLVKLWITQKFGHNEPMDLK